jgi:glycosyltransferase involved in cell wall biosynthesis
MRSKKLISIVTPTYNEELNVVRCYEEVKKFFIDNKKYQYEHMFIDNDSNDNTRKILKTIAAKDKNIKLIFNKKNYGPHLSPYFGILASSGDAVITYVADGQMPVSLFKKFIASWEKGFKVSIGLRKSMEDGFFIKLARIFFYKILNFFSEADHYPHFIGFTLMDKDVVQKLILNKGSRIYFRSLLVNIGFSLDYHYYDQPKRVKGKSKQKFFDLIDYAFLGLLAQSDTLIKKILYSLIFLSFGSFGISLSYFIYKILNWHTLSLGIAPIMIFLSFSFGFLFFSIAVILEKITSVDERLGSKNIVEISERINFND